MASFTHPHSVCLLRRVNPQLVATTTSFPTGASEVEAEWEPSRAARRRKASELARSP